MEPRIQYAKTSDGVSIAYSTVGEGRSLIGMPPPGFNHAELVWEMFGAIWQPVLGKYRAVTYDSRGSGLSDRSAIDFSMEAMIRDLEAVVERSGLDSFVLASWASAVPIASDLRSCSSGTRLSAHSHRRLRDVLGLCAVTRLQGGPAVVGRGLGDLHGDVRPGAVDMGDLRFGGSMPSSCAHAVNRRRCGLSGSRGRAAMSPRYYPA